MTNQEYIARPAGEKDNTIIGCPMFIAERENAKGKPGKNSKAQPGPSESLKIEYGSDEQKVVARAGDCICTMGANGKILHKIGILGKESGEAIK